MPSLGRSTACPAPDMVVIGDDVESFHTGKRERLLRGIVIGGGRIIRTFDPENRDERANLSGLEAIEFPGAVIIPGFIDSHNHQPTAARDFYEVKTAHATDLHELRGIIAAAAKSYRPGTWITTEHSLTLSQLSMTQFPTKTDFDDICPNHPVAIRFGAHSMVLNTVALELTGFMSNPVDPPHGRIRRDSTTRIPSGVIHEYGAIERVLKHLSRRSQAELCFAMREIQKTYASEGITTVRTTGLRDGDLGVYQDLLQKDRYLNNRVFGGPRLDPTSSTRGLVEAIHSWTSESKFVDGWLEPDAVKIFVDAGVESIYDGDTALFVDAKKLLTLVTTAAAAGWSVTCHAISSRAIELTLEVYAKTVDQLASEKTLVIEHAYLATKQSLARAKSLRVWLSTQPAIGSIEARLLATKLNSRDRQNFIPLATAHNLGVQCALGSDWNATPGTQRTPYSPLETIRLAAGSRNGTTDRLGGGQVIPIETALFMHTRAGAQLVNAPDLGAIWPGARADLAVISGDITDHLDGGNVKATIVDGRVVHNK